MRESVLSALQQGVLVGDGAMGTLLQAQGLPPGLMPEVWNAERPEVIRAVHRAYLEAGAQIVTANTFGSNHLRLRDAALGHRAAELARRGVELALDAVGDRAWVAGDIGPTGRLLEPLGPLTISQAEEAYAQQALALAEAGAHLLLVETMQDIEEACCAVRMAKAHTTLPVFCTFSFDRWGRTIMGLRAAEAAMRAQDTGADAVGANCGEGPAAVLAALEAMRGACRLPLVAQANAGVPQLGEGARAVWDVTSEQMAHHARQFVAQGARVVGGCCGSGPAHIAAIAAALRDAM